jgi:hypothetical protein
VAPFGFGRSPRFGRCFRRPRLKLIKLSDSAEQFAAMTKQDAELFWILLCQIADDREVDAILGKALSVLRQTNRLEPLGDGLSCQFAISPLRS